MNNAFTIMVQGTTSDAGKSVMVAGICRYLLNNGIRVAPFKSQNMALNSAVTVHGGEIGRAQALQAIACKLEPHTDMNPVLLKPSSDMGAQVIIHGKPVSSMQARAYHGYKKEAMKAVLASHQRLSDQYDVVVVEGAGSPAEINLRDRDIANMGFAEAVDCPVIIVADIDRGGVFAHLVGTLELLSESERNRTVGFIINRFRGDISLLQPGLDWLEEKTGKPVLGVIPYLHEFYLDAEDAISVDQTMKGSGQDILNIVIPAYSRISNHTDFDALRLHPKVHVHYIKAGVTPPPCDLVILPGTKNVRADLDWLKAHNWPHYIERHLRYGGKMIGICGGYQMLGEWVNDDLGVEDCSGRSEGLSYIPMRTELKQEKLTEIKQGTLRVDKSEALTSGYEIHCGESFIHGEYTSLIRYSDTESEGYISPDNQIIGTYLHGIFDKKEVTSVLLNWAGGEAISNQAVDLDAVREEQLERLADTLGKHIAWDKLNAAIGKDLTTES